MKNTKFFMKDTFLENFCIWINEKTNLYFLRKNCEKILATKINVNKLSTRNVESYLIQ